MSWLEALRKLEGEDNNLGLSIDSSNFVSSEIRLSNLKKGSTPRKEVRAEKLKENLVFG